MRSAPPVQVSVGPFVWGRRIVAVLAALGAFTGGLAVWQQGIAPERAMWMGAVWAMVGSAAWWIWSREAMPAGQLSWDGQSWWFRVDGEVAFPVRVTLQWDAGQAMLVRLSSQALGRWSRHVWLHAAAKSPQMSLPMPTPWHGLRCAVYAGDTL